MKLAALIVLIFVAACHKSSDKPQENAPVAENVAETKVVPPKPVETKPKISKVLRESVYFSASLEREALKLLLKDNSFQKNTLFSVLSYILETQSGVRKSTPLGLDCGKFQLQFVKDQIFVEKACQKPFREVVRINILSADKDFEFLFKAGEWGRVLGLSAALTGSDIKCRVSIVEQKLNLLNCENWFFQVSEDQMSSTVIKTTEFIFQRKAEKQFVIKGGFYKELILNKKIDIVVPLEGKIKIIEKEIKVIDEFADLKDGVIHEKKEPIEIKPIEEGKTPEEIQAAKEGRPVERPEENQPVEGSQSSGQEGSVQDTQKSGIESQEGINQDSSPEAVSQTTEGEQQEPIQQPPTESNKTRGRRR
ncbi:MAG: hypothetical protein K0R29_2316 [Pseudobdellovibrio sp.]|jgi:hypothetical protein|nr:hypothetical protein [Pseudobdellovibrio sp.]